MPVLKPAPRNWEFHDEQLKDFWKFVNARQWVWYRRNVKKQPAPWTKDPILREFFFTNVYRELDRGTIYLTQKIIEWKIQKATKEDIVFNIMIYRLFNHIPTFDFLANRLLSYIPVGQWKWEEEAKQLKEWKAKGNQVFTGAFTVTGVRFGGFDEKIDNICWLIGDIQQNFQKNGLGKEIVKANTMEELFNRINNTYGFGRFLAYEVTIDVNYAFERFTEDDFVNAGPGCKRGINIIFPDIRSVPDYVMVINFLRRNQDFFFHRYGLNFPKYDGKDLTLRNIEHSLCEYQKYVKRRSGKLGGRARRFAPSDLPLPNKK